MMEPKTDLDKALMKAAMDAAMNIANLPVADQQLAHAAMDYASAQKMPLQDINGGNITQAHMMALAVGLEAAAAVWRVSAEADFEELDAASTEALNAVEELGASGC